jgi:transcriptional regulator with XRE-family HTH domain
MRSADRAPLRRLGAEIRARREALGLSQEELGHLSGLHRTYVGSVERAERNLTLSCLIRVAQALQLAAHELLARAGL